MRLPILGPGNFQQACSQRRSTPILAALVLAAAVGVFGAVRMSAQPVPPVIITNVGLSASCPLTLGTSAIWFVSAVGGTAPLQFKFWLHDETSGTWTLLQDYSTSSIAFWQPASAGTFSLQVWVRSAGSSANYEAWQNSAVCSVVDFLPTTVTSLTATPSPGAVATPVTWTATATGGIPPLQYKFWIRDETTGAWSVLQEYSPQNQAPWTPSAAGAYTVQVWVRSAQSPGPAEAWRNSSYLVAMPGTTTRASVATGGTEANNPSELPSVSADGRFVSFFSGASNLVAGDTNGNPDVFVRNLADGTIERISVATDGTQAAGSSDYSSISADGRFVAFYSTATNLVNGDTNATSDIFVRDRQTNTTTRVSVADNGTQGNGSSDTPSISADGRFVAFSSTASNLVSNDTNGLLDVFVHDRQSKTTERVSVPSAGGQANGVSAWPSISADGRFVAFLSSASNLVSGDTNGFDDVFVRDRQTGTTGLISKGLGGAAANGSSNSPSISADGRYVAFSSLASNLVSGDTNGGTDVFVYDRQTAAIILASVAADGIRATARPTLPQSVPTAASSRFPPTRRISYPRTQTDSGMSSFTIARPARRRA